MNYLISNASEVIQFVFYLSVIIYLITLIWPEKRTTINDFYTDGLSSLTKEDRKLLKLSGNKLFKNFLPSNGSKSYVKAKKQFDKMGGYGKYKTLDFYFVKKTYSAAVTMLGSILVILFPSIIYQIQIKMSIEDPKLIILPPLFLLFSLAMPIFIYVLPDYELKSISAKKERALKKELISLGIMIHTMLETGNGVYDILNMVKEIKPVYKEFIVVAMNEYFISHRGALETLKEKVNIQEFDMIADSLIFADETDNNYAAKFLGEYLDRLETTNKISDEKGNKIKPYILLLSAMPPLVAALLIWFYPWIIQATDSLTKGINGF